MLLTWSNENLYSDDMNTNLEFWRYYWETMFRILEAPRLSLVYTQEELTMLELDYVEERLDVFRRLLHE